MNLLTMLRARETIGTGGEQSAYLAERGDGPVRGIVRRRLMRDPGGGLRPMRLTERGDGLLKIVLGEREVCVFQKVPLRRSVARVYFLKTSASSFCPVMLSVIPAERAPPPGPYLRMEPGLHQLTEAALREMARTELRCHMT
ncbi:MAG: hypothetical protein VYE81_07490 [Planctomycetota bacterium]|nr:hypothetical protein [Planctomycetota bacterium]